MEQHFPLKISEDLFNLFLLLFDLFGFPGETIQKIFEYSKRFNLLPPFSKCSNRPRLELPPNVGAWNSKSLAGPNRQWKLQKPAAILGSCPGMHQIHP